MAQVASTQAPGSGGPRTRAEMDAMVLQRSELKAQLKSLFERRIQLVTLGRQSLTSAEFERQVAEIDARAKTLNAQVSTLDDRISDGIGRGLMNDPLPAVPPMPAMPEMPGAPGLLVPPPANPLLDTRVVAGALAGEALLFVVLGVALWRFAWRRMRTQLMQVLGDSSSKLQQLQQSVDVIAVEVERIAEGQRFVSKMLGEGDAQLLPVSRKDKISAP